MPGIIFMTTDLAFNNVKINQGDSIFLNGERLNYDGKQNKPLFMMTSLKDKNMLLTTDQLNYSLETNIAHTITVPT